MTPAFETLPNGVRLVAVPMPSMQSVCVGVWAGVGGRHESARTSGISHFLEHLLFKGTQRRNARQISASVEGIGGWLNAFTCEDHTCYYAKAQSRHFPRLLDVLTDMYRHSVLPPVEIEREREVILEEIAMYADQPSQVAQELLTEVLWPSHALGRPITGTSQTVESLTPGQLSGHYQRRYAGRNSLCVVAGNLDLPDAMERMSKSFDGLEKGGRPRVAAPLPLDGLRVAVKQMDAEQCQLAIGFRLPGRLDSARFGLRLLSVIFGENMSSRLFQRLRERHGICYSVNSEIHLLEDSGALSIFVGLDEKNLGKAIKLIFQEIRKLQEKPVSSRELREAKDYTIGNFLMGLESSSNQMTYAGESILGYGRLSTPQETVLHIESVTAAELQSLANSWLGTAQLAVASVGKHQDVDRLRAMLPV